jgi:formyl-CoA transferase
VRELKVDVFATNQLPRSYDKLGISPERLRQVKPDLIWLGITGFGPEHEEAAYDPILQARGGLMELTGAAEGEPQVVGIPLPDMGTSEHAYGLLMKALYTRAKTGQGTALHLSMFASTVSWLTVPITLTASFGHKVSRHGNQHQFFAPVNVYPTRDGFVYLAVGNDRQFQALVKLPEFQALDLPQYQNNAGRIADVERLNQALGEILAGLTSEEVLDKLRGIRLPVSKIQTIAEVIADPLVAPRLLRSTDPRTGLTITLAPPPHSTRFLEQSGGALGFPPRLGEHNAEILGSMDLSQEDLAGLQREGII